MTEDIMSKLEQMGCNLAAIRERFMSDDQFYVDCLEQVLYDDSIEQLSKSLQDGDVKQAFFHAHTMKGLLANVGLTPLKENVALVVEPLRNGELEGVREQFDTLMQQLQVYRDLL